MSGDSLTREYRLSRLFQVQALQLFSLQPVNSVMETAAIAEQPDPELYITEQPRPVTNDGNYALNICVVSKGEAFVDRFHPREHAAHNGDAAIELYLCEIGQVKQLTPEEEIKLVARTKRGERKARERLIKGNLRRVVKISREDKTLASPCST